MTNHTNQRQPNVIGTLRAVMPNRALTSAEALRIAELQANKLLALTNTDRPAVSDGVIAGLPRIKVQHLSPLPMSGYTAWNRGHWLIALNGSESPLRQRFSLAHEFKHVLDHPFVDEAYSKPRGQNADEWAERTCDYFAGCLLMPKAWVKSLYCNQGIQETPTLARLFQVSQAAMRVRLLQLGLVEQGPRCAPYRREATVQSITWPAYPVPTMTIAV
jgi:Zn-dependent peptidase ImmA (M78 family)